MCATNNHVTIVQQQHSAQHTTRTSRNASFNQHHPPLPPLRKTPTQQPNQSSTSRSHKHTRTTIFFFGNTSTHVHLRYKHMLNCSTTVYRVSIKKRMHSFTRSYVVATSTHGRTIVSMLRVRILSARRMRGPLGWFNTQREREPYPIRSSSTLSVLCACDRGTRNRNPSRPRTQQTHTT